MKESDSVEALPLAIRGIDGKALLERSPRNSSGLLRGRAVRLQLLNVMEEMTFHERKWGAVVEGEIEAGLTFEEESCSDGTFVRGCPFPIHFTVTDTPSGSSSSRR